MLILTALMFTSGCSREIIMNPTAAPMESYSETSSGMSSAAPAPSESASEATSDMSTAEPTVSASATSDMSTAEPTENASSTPEETFTAAPTTEPTTEPTVKPTEAPKPYTVVFENEGTVRFEAEEVNVTSYVISSANPSKIVSRADASNGKFLAAATGDNGANKYFSFTMELKMNCLITMSAAYAQPEKYKANSMDMRQSYVYIIDENKTVGLSENYTLSSRTDITEWQTIIYDAFSLPAGSHSVKVIVGANTGKGNPNIDYIEFTVKEISEVPSEDEGEPENGEIHTRDQLSYIEDSVENVSRYANGVSEKSIPRPVKLDFSEDQNVKASESSRFVIEIADNVKFEGSTIVTGLTEKEYDYYNPALGETIYFRGADNEKNLENAAVYNVSVTSVTPRIIYVDGITNVRDIGGIKSTLAEGAVIRQGLYYRGAAINNITAKGKKELYEHLGVRAEIDLRDSYQCTGPYVAGITYNAIPIPSGTESTRFEKFEKEYCEIFEIISHADTAPVYLHCTAGADRTGICTFMLLTVCGAEYNDIARDYMFTNFSTQGLRSLDSEFKNWWSKLDDFDGETKADKAKSWMMSKGIPEATVERIREIFVEGYK